MRNQEYIQNYLGEIKRICDAIPHEDIDRAIEILFKAWQEGRTIFIIGNGGSASTASHFACDLAQATITPSKPRLRSVSLVDNVPLMSAFTNDFGWENVYIEQLRSFARPGDVAIGISVHGGSGKDKAGAWSQNLLKAMQYVKDLGGPTIGLIGFDGGPMKTLVDAPIVVPANSTPLVESAHVVLHHLIAFRLQEIIRAHTLRRAVFFGRDGVLVRPYALLNEQSRIPSPKQRFAVSVHARNSLEQLRVAGFVCILVSQKPEIAYQDLSEYEWQPMHQFVEALPFDDVFLCNHRNDGECICKKPKPGLLLEAAHKWQIALPDSFFIGDTASDLGAAKAVGCKTILLDWPYNRHLESDYRAKHLQHASEIVQSAMQP